MEIKVNRINGVPFSIVGIMPSGRAAISFNKLNGVWYVSSSTCSPGNLKGARVVRETVAAAWEKLDEIIKEEGA